MATVPLRMIGIDLRHFRCEPCTVRELKEVYVVGALHVPIDTEVSFEAVSSKTGSSER